MRDELRDRLSGLYWRTRHRAENRWYDLRAVLAGYCNNTPWRPEPDRGGGYAFWRCALTRCHDGMHRTRNYVWTDDGRTDYLPVPIGSDMPAQPWDRNPTLTLRQARARRRWHRRHRAELRAARQEAGDG